MEFTLSETYGYLSPGRTYYFKFFTVVDGAEYTSSVGSFSTAGYGGIGFDSLSASISENDAQLSAWLDNPDGLTLSEIGLQLGESTQSAQAKAITNNIGWTRAHLQYNASQLFSSLIPDRQYYARYYAKYNEFTYYSDYFSFVTPADIVFGAIAAADISFESARISCWMNNATGKSISSLGFLWQKGNASAQRREIVSGIGWTSAYLDYTTKGIIGKLEPSTQYHFQYYVISGGIEYRSDTVTFTTKSHTHTYTYAVTAAPTTSATGVLTGTCSGCGGTTTVTMPALNTTNYNYAVVTAATCTANGTGRYTWKTTTYGTFSFDATIPKTGHSYSDTVTPPTCTTQGYTTHTCSRCGDSYRDSYVDALGHDWNAPVYVWVDDNSSVAASRICRNDLSHIEAESAATTCEVTKEATYEEEGEITYTATFENAAFVTQTKTVATPKLERPNPFDDVMEGTYYYTPVLWAYYHDPQITSGTGDATFSPNATCTRAQIVTFLWRAAGSPEPTSTDCTFTDVPENAYYTKAVSGYRLNSARHKI